MKVVIFGATGFIGSSVAEAFVRSGHIAYGVSRSPSSAKELARKEIVPLICDPVTEEGRKVWGPVAAVADVGE
jgi:nucleoside-diphosphate-sugar epimerase